MENRRFCLNFSERDILTISQRQQELDRSWLPIKPNLKTIADLAQYITRLFQIHHSCPHGILLSIDGYVLPEFASIDEIVSDKAIICVKRKRNIVDVEEEERTVETIPVLESKKRKAEKKSKSLKKKKRTHTEKVVKPVVEEGEIDTLRSHTELLDRRNKFVHQVFLSFRGEDVRNGFQSHLLKDLRRAGFNVFMDNDGLEHGKDIQEKLLEAIRLSYLSIVTLSPRYAESRWCLDELVEIMESSDRYVLPVFFDVEPTDVRHQTGFYKTFFEAHEKRFVGEIGRVDGWRKALQGIADLKGPSLKDANGDQAQLIENIIKEVREKLVVKKLALPRDIIGRDSIVRRICNWIQDGSQDAGVGVIHGQCGIGKTVVAQIVFNASCNYFDRSCFLGDVRRVLEHHNGMVRLQRKLISDISRKKAGKIFSESEGMTKIRDAIGPWKILLVLDDVEEKHLRGLFDHPEWFCPGSKIIITTRNQQVKKLRMFQQEFGVSELNLEESTKLFSRHVFDQDRPLKGYEELSDRFVNYCGGLPLAIRVLAPVLRGEDLEIWEDNLNKLKKYPNQEIHGVLQLSYDSLEDKQNKNLFLHIACHFVYTFSEYAFKGLEACGVYTEAGFKSLENRHLVSVDKVDGELIMHPLIQEMGREVVRNESIDEPGLRSRLWDHKETLSMLRQNKGTSSVKSLQLASNRNSLSLESVSTDSFTKLVNLNLLKLSYVRLNGGYQHFPKAVKWLYWHGCPLDVIPGDMKLYELAVLEMRNSQLSQVWVGNKLLGALKILDLSYSCSLRSTPDFSNANELERIILKGCVSLVEIHDSIGSLTKLTHLNLKDCSNLRRIPNTIENKLSIREVDLSGCRYLFTAPNRMETSIILTGNLNSQSQILAPFSSLNLSTSIEKLTLGNCGISSDAIFDSLSCLSSSLRELDLSWNPIREIKKDLRSFTLLHSLTMINCENLQLVSLLPGSVNFYAGCCFSLKRIEFQQEKDAGVCAYYCHSFSVIAGAVCSQSIEDFDVEEANNFYKSVADDIGSKSRCPCGIYSVFIPGDHILEGSLSVRRPGSAILYTVSWVSDYPIKFLYVNVSYHEDRYHNRIREYLQIENLTTKCKWLYFPKVYPLTPCLHHGNEVTSWNSKWCLMPDKRIRSGEQLRVSFHSCGNFPSKCETEIVYEVNDEYFHFTNNFDLQDASMPASYHGDFHFRTDDLSMYEKQEEQGIYGLSIGDNI